MRVFIAINFNNNTRSQLVSLQDELREKAKRGRFTEPENMHLTLAFLGECNATETITIKSVMDTIDFGPFGITVDSIGRFKRDGGDLWWAGVRENRYLSALHGILTDKLTAAGFMLESRKFNPHITLGRELVTRERPWKTEPFGETVSSIELMKSERLKGVLTYTAIHSRRFI